MNTYANKKPAKKSVVAAQSVSQKQNNATFQLVDNRPQTTIQKKLQASITPNTNTSPIQLVLRDSSNAGLEARLIREYHKHEEDGDGYSVTSRNVTHHQNAIQEYQAAKRKRKRAGKLHYNQDGGHLQAISTLGDKISVRREKIKGLQQQKKTGKKPKRPALRY